MSVEFEVEFVDTCFNIFQFLLSLKLYYAAKEATTGMWRYLIAYANLQKSIENFGIASSYAMMRDGSKIQARDHSLMTSCEIELF